MANGWLLALHVITLILWSGYLLAVSRLLAAAAVDETGAPALTTLARRMYRKGALPAGLIAVLTGLVMLHGVGGQFGGVGDAFRYYLKPRLPDGTPSVWYVTFHVKLVSVALLIACDVWTGLQLRASAGQPRGWPLGIIVGLVTAVVGLLAVWLPLAPLMGVGPARTVGYCVALPAGIAAFWFVSRLARRPGRGRFVVIHGCVAALALLIVLLVLARPLAAIAV